MHFKAVLIAGLLVFSAAQGAEMQEPEADTLQLWLAIQASLAQEEKAAEALENKLYGMQGAAHSTLAQGYYGDDAYDMILPEDHAVGDYLALKALRAKRAVQFAALGKKLKEESRQGVTLVGTDIKSRNCCIL